MRKFAMVLAATICLATPVNAQLMSIPGPFVGPGTPWGFGGGMFGAGPGMGMGGMFGAMTGMGMLGGIMGGMGGNNWGAPVVGGGAIGYGVPMVGGGAVGYGAPLPPVYMPQQVYAPPPPPSSVEIIQGNPTVRYYKTPNRRLQTRVIVKEKIVTPRVVEEVDVVETVRPQVVRPAPGPVTAYGNLCPSGSVPQPQAVYDNYGRWVGQRLICY